MSHSSMDTFLFRSGWILANVGTMLLCGFCIFQSVFLSGHYLGMDGPWRGGDSIIIIVILIILITNRIIVPDHLSAVDSTIIPGNWSDPIAFGIITYRTLLLVTAIFPMGHDLSRFPRSTLFAYRTDYRTHWYRHLLFSHNTVSEKYWEYD